MRINRADGYMDNHRTCFLMAIFCRDTVECVVIRILLNFDKNLIVKKENNIDDKVKDKTIIKDKIGRNDPCPLGCGIKYKKCGIDKKCKKISEIN